MKPTLFLSQVMIVKNEESNIRRALSWGQHIVDEQIVVDTGSTDATVSIAREMGAAVYQYSWNNDFSAAKNFAIEHCHGQWIIFLDADEYFSEEESRKIMPILMSIRDNHKNAEAIFSMIYNLDDRGEIMSSGSMIRIFRNLPGLRYQRRIHEQLRHENGGVLHTIDCTADLGIFHTGYAPSVAQEKKKNERNLEMIHHELDINDEDPEMLGYLGDTLYSMGEAHYHEAVKAYNDAIRTSKGRETELSIRLSVCYINLMRIYIALSKMDTGDILNGNAVNLEKTILQLYHEGVRVLPQDADLPFLTGCFFFETQDHERALQYLDKAITVYEKYGSLNKAITLATHLPDCYSMIAFSFLMTGDARNAVNTAVSVLKSDRNQYLALRTLLLALSGETTENIPAAPADQIIALLGRLYDLKALHDRLLIYKAAGTLQDTTLRSRIGDLFTQEEIEKINQAGL